MSNPIQLSTSNALIVYTPPQSATEFIASAVASLQNNSLSNPNQGAHVFVVIGGNNDESAEFSDHISIISEISNILDVSDYEDDNVTIATNTRRSLSAAFSLPSTKIQR